MSAVFTKKISVVGHLMFYFTFISLARGYTQWKYWKGNPKNVTFLWRDNLLYYCVINVCDTTWLRFGGSGKTSGRRWPLNSVFLFFFLILFLLRWVFVAAHGLSLIAASGGYSSLRCAGFSSRWLLLLRSMVSRCAGFSSCGTRA